MSDAGIKFDDTDVREMFKKLKAIMPGAARAGMADTLEWAVGVIPVWFIRGPRPKRLVRKSGNLEEKIKWQIEARATGELVGVVRSTGRSPRGFDYGNYWENFGTAHRPFKPRPFLSPLITERGDVLNATLEANYIEQINRRWK